MKKRMTRILSMMMAVAMIMTLAACGGGTTGTTPSTSTPSASTPAAPEKTPNTVKEGEKVVLTFGAPAKANVTEWDNNKLTLWLEEQTGYDLQYVHFSADGADLKTQLATMTTANEKLPDIMYYFNLGEELENQYGAEGYWFDMATYFNDDAAMDYFAQKVGYDYREMINKNMDPVMVQDMYKQALDSEGHWWAFPCMSEARNSVPRQMFYINQSWLDKLGLEMPTTLDEFATVLKAFKTKDPNGNGKADEMGVVGGPDGRSDIVSWIINNFIFTNPNHHFNVTDDGKLYLPYDKDEYREGLKAAKALYDEGLIDQLTWTITSAEMKQVNTPADGVAKVGVIGGHVELRVTNESELLYQYEPLLPFEGSYAPCEQREIYFYTRISAECEHPDAAFEVLLHLASAEGTARQQFGEKDVDWQYVTDYKTGITGIQILDTEAYSGQTDAVWGNVGAVTRWLRSVGDGRDLSGEFKADPNSSGTMTWSQFRLDLGDRHSAGVMEIAAKNNPKNLFYTKAVTLNQAETDQAGTALTDINDYMKTARAEFVTGVRDINSDKEWAAHCETLKTLGAEAWTAATHSAYDRANG